MHYRRLRHLPGNTPYRARRDPRPPPVAHESRRRTTNPGPCGRGAGRRKSPEAHTAAAAVRSPAIEKLQLKRAGSVRSSRGLENPPTLVHSAHTVQEQTMIEFDLDTAHSILLVRPQSALDTADFVELSKAVDPLIETTGELAGLIINAPKFPGWDSFGSMVTHFRFVKDHQQHIKKVAVVTDSHLGDVAEHLASHFVSAKIRHFPGEQLDQARQWIISGS